VPLFVVLKKVCGDKLNFIEHQYRSDRGGKSLFLLEQRGVKKYFLSGGSKKKLSEGVKSAEKLSKCGKIVKTNCPRG